MNIKESQKIRNLLDYKKYHLYESTDGENYSWKLFRKYEGWLTDNSKPIMTSETHTYKDLYKFAKEHYVPNLNKAIYIFSMFMILIALIICIINIIFFQSDILRGVILGIDIMCILISYIEVIISDKQIKISRLELKERIKEYESIKR